MGHLGIFISVVIRTYNSAKTLSEVIGRLHLEGADEVIIVDSGSTDDTLNIARKQGGLVIEAPLPFNYSKSLNLGFSTARNPWILVLSSHATPQADDFLDRYRREVDVLPKDVAVIYGASTTSGKINGLASGEKICLYDRSNYREIVSLCGNGNALYRRAVWDENPFDETIRTAEDKLWLEAILQRNFRFAFLPTVCTLNRNQGSLRYMYLKGFGDAKAFPRTPQFRPMNLYQLGGALKNHTVLRLRGEIDQGNWLRYAAHIVGQFFGSRGEQNNYPAFRDPTEKL